MSLHHTKSKLKKTWAITWVRRAAIGLGLFLVFSIVWVTSVVIWYKNTQNDTPTRLGATFVPYYASSLGVEPKETLDALIAIGVQHFRLTSYWNASESTRGSYDFTDLDWQFEKAEKAGATVSLAIGLRQPRYPECHMPDWAKGLPRDQWQPALEKYMTAVVNRYKSSPSLVSYQLENEFFNTFGECTEFSRDRLVSEYELVKRLDQAHPIIVSRSNNTPVIATGAPRPDVVGISIYRRVWDAQFTKKYFNYPLPTWYYAYNAGMQKMLTNRDSVVHELQMEAWPPNGKFIADISIAEQDKSMNASMFKGRVEFAKDTGMKQIDLWGAEWWYARKVQGDPSLWNEAQKVFDN